MVDSKKPKPIHDAHAVREGYAHAVFIGFFLACGVGGFFFGFSKGGIWWALAGVVAAFGLSFVIMKLSHGFLETLTDKAGGFLYLGKKPSWSVRQQLAADLQQARARMARGRWGEALTLVDGALKKDPLFPEALYMRAEILWEGFESAGPAKESLRKLFDAAEEDDTHARWGRALMDKIQKLTRGRTMR